MITKTIITALSMFVSNGHVSGEGEGEYIYIECDISSLSLRGKEKPVNLRIPTDRGDEFSEIFGELRRDGWASYRHAPEKNGLCDSGRLSGEVSCNLSGSTLSLSVSYEGFNNSGGDIELNINRRTGVAVLIKQSRRGDVNIKEEGVCRKLDSDPDSRRAF